MSKLQVKPEDFFEKLPDEIILLILSHLSTITYSRANKVCLVNRRFARLCTDSSLKTELNVPNPKDLDAVKELINQHCQHLLRFSSLSLKSFSQRNTISAEAATYALQNCPRLIELAIFFNDDEETFRLLDAIKIHGVSLKRLSCMLDVHHILLQRKAKCLNRLTHINLIYAMEGEEWMTIIADHCPQLKAFRIGYSTFTRDKVFIHFLQKVKDTLELLEMAEVAAMTDKSLVHLSQCQKLHTLELLDADDMRHRGLETVLKLPKLKNLSLGYLPTFPIGAKFFALLSGCSSLDRLYLGNKNFQINDFFLRGIADRCPMLSSLSVAVDDSVTDNDVRYVLSKCKGLKSFDLEVPRCKVWTGGYTFVGPSKMKKCVEDFNRELARTECKMRMYELSESMDRFKERKCDMTWIVS